MVSAVQRGYLDEVGSFFAAHGMPPVAGRIVGHLLICEPAEQSFEELCQAVGASRGSVSTMTRLLAQLGLVERRTSTGRSLNYRLHDDAWTRLLEDDLRSATRLRAIANEGLRLQQGRSSKSRQRLTAMRAFYTFLELQTASVLDAWQKRSKR